MASLAGIPPLAGWFAKFVMFRSIIDAGTGWGVRARGHRRGQLGDRVLLLLRASSAQMWFQRAGRRRPHADPGAASRSPVAIALTARDRRRRRHLPAALRAGRGAGVLAGAAADAIAPPASGARARSRSTASSSSRCTSPRSASSRRGAARGAPGATSSRAPRSARCSARASRARSTGAGASSASPTRSSSSRPARATGGSRATCCAPTRRARARCATCSSSVRPRCATSSATRLALEPADEALGPFVRRGAGRRARARCRARVRCSPRSTSCPRSSSTGVVLANELLDNLPFGIAECERRAAGWRCASRSTATASSPRCSCRPKPPTPTRSTRSPTDSRSPTARGCRSRAASTRGSRRAARLLRHGARARDRLRRRRDGLVDRGADGWLRTYRAHERGGPPARRARRAGHHRRRRARAAAARGARAGFTRRGRRVAGRVAARPRHRRARRGGPPHVGGSARTSATSKRSPAAAASAKPPRSPTRPASAPTASSPFARRTHRTGLATSLRALTRSQAGDAWPTRSKHCCKKAARSRRREASARTRSSPTRRSTTTPSATGRASGPSRRSRSTGARSGTRSSSGTSRSRSGSSAASSTSPYNCLDRHVDAGHGDQVAFHWEGEPGDTRARHLPRAARRDVPGRERCCASFGVEKGDRVAIYMGMVPETVAAMLACARIGAPHSVVFGGFTAQSLQDRINDAEAKVLITADGAWRRGAVVALKEIADEALAETPSIEHVLVLRRTENDVAMQDGRDVWWHDAVPGQPAECACEEMDSEDLLYILYTSGTTGQAQGHHAHDRRLPHAVRVHAQARVRPASPTPTSTGAPPTSAGSPATRTSSTARSRTAPRACSTKARPTSPTRTGFWSIVEKYKVTIFYTAPTAIRTFMKWGDEFPARARPVVAAADRDGRRADQPRGVGLVLPGDRRRALPGRRHVVADRDRRHHDQRAARARRR